MPQTIESIIQLCDLGFRVHPLLARNKVPILQDWQLKATTDESIVRQWAAIHKNCNWGLACGEKSKIFVVDIDVEHGGGKTWKKWMSEYSIPETVSVATGGGGSHYYFVYPKNLEIRNSASKIGKGIDIRGEGGQVVIPPSIHPNGRAYEWIKSPQEVKVAKAPAWLIGLIKDTVIEEEQVTIGDKMEKGTRNNQIYHQSLFLARQGALQEITVNAMVAWCEASGEKDVTREEIEATVDSAYKYNLKERQKAAPANDVELSDVGNAIRMLDRSGKQIIYVPSAGWHVWDEKHWGYDTETLGVRKFAIEAMDALKLDALEQMKSTTDRVKAAQLHRLYQWAIGSHSIGKLNAMVEVAKAFPAIVRNIAQLDPEDTAFLLNCGNGLVNMVTGELLPHRQEQYITRLTGVNYNPNAKCKNWMNTLKLAFGGDEALISYFQRAIGYSVSGATSEQCFFICWGESGNNGKSTMLETIQKVMGCDYATMTDARVISSRDKDNHVLSSLAALNKVRFVSINEVAESAVLDEELIKQLTGGDTLQAKKLYMEPFTFKPIFKIWVRANNKPTVRGTGESFWRRVKLIPFTQPIPPEKRKPRHEIDALLAAEAEGILAWIVRGFQEWNKNGLQDPAAVKAAGMQYRESSDIVAQFMEECVVNEKNGSVARQILYGVFREWCRDQGLRYIITAEKFARRIGDKLEQHDRVREKGVPVWKEINLTNNAKMNYSF